MPQLKAILTSFGVSVERAGYIIFLKASPEDMKFSEPQVICPTEDKVVSVYGSRHNRDAKKHQERFMSGSAHIASVRNSVMDAIVQGECNEVSNGKCGNDHLLCMFSRETIC